MIEHFDVEPDFESRGVGVQFGVVVTHGPEPRLVEWSCFLAMSTMYAHRLCHSSHDDDSGLFATAPRHQPDHVYVVYKLTHSPRWFVQTDATHRARTGEGLPRLPEGW
ncbi:hypothetical protein PQD13_gp19 [Gordonia phage Clawz]|uniref:Uncharacterized protein n=1 Tax=Gordonia phage Clawz TaxID=2743910 RepID=A0AAE7F7Z8_9CAUD|nr:hypothetical protein PQD13_gp19 [Gordonia phage Clawz]QKY79931.1 hypothetical protein SEA_CLAWZ_19 [Gordonia phage Clawz]